MFLHNVIKCLAIFPKVYVSSDSDEIIKRAENIGAIGIKRPIELCGDAPNIHVYQHAIKYMGGVGGFVAVQANSPTVDPDIIWKVKWKLLEGNQEAITVHEDGSIYGSVWGMTAERLMDYPDPYKPQPDATVVDTSIDIHTLEEYNLSKSTL